MSPSYTNSFFTWAVITHCWSPHAVMPNHGENNQKCTTGILERHCVIKFVKFSSSFIALLVQFTSISSARWHFSSDLSQLCHTWGNMALTGTDWINLSLPYICFCHKNSYVIENTELNQPTSFDDYQSHQTHLIYSLCPSSTRHVVFDTVSLQK